MYVLHTLLLYISFFKYIIRGNVLQEVRWISEKKEHEKGDIRICSKNSYIAYKTVISNGL